MTPNPAAEILSMIETVSPDDVAKLDQIDARVWCYLNDDGGNIVFVGKEKFGYTYAFGDDFGVDSGIYNTDEKQYTRSRDELKKIRPQGWCFDLDSYYNHPAGKVLFDCSCDKINYEDCLQTPAFLTEELAELHCIIQAIEYER